MSSIKNQTSFFFRAKEKLSSNCNQQFSIWNTTNKHEKNCTIAFFFWNFVWDFCFVNRFLFVKKKKKGVTSFDNIFVSWITIITMISLEGWVDVMYNVKKKCFLFASFHVLFLFEQKNEKKKNIWATFFFFKIWFFFSLWFFSFCDAFFKKKSNRVSQAQFYNICLFAIVVKIQHFENINIFLTTQG